MSDMTTIRATIPADTPILIELARGTEVFKPMEIQALREVLDDYHDHAHKQGHRAVTYVQDGQVLGFAYFAPTAMTDRTWHLWWIAVGRHTQARGIGGELLRYVEEEIRRADGRILLVETSGMPHYELTRRFYVKHQYEQDAVLHDFYSDGDDMVVYRKRLAH